VKKKKMTITHHAQMPRAGADAAEKSYPRKTNRAPSENFPYRNCPMDGRLQIRGKNKGGGTSGYVSS
jgi:hypothetical protein